MKRFVIAFLFALLAPSAWAQCTLNSACATQPCLWSTAGSWTAGPGCTAPPTSAGEPWTITGTATAPRFVIIGANTATGQGTITNGVVATLPDSGESLTITGASGDDITLGTGGVLRLRKGDSLICDSTAASCEYRQNNGGQFDLQGYVHETTIAGAITDVAPSASNCGVGDPGRRWTFNVASGAAFAAANGRVRFLNGKARNREFEIVGVSGSAVTVCSALTDALSISTYGSQRLTPHATIGTLGTVHATPTVTDSTSPYYAVPAAGDAVAIIQDVTFSQTGGTNGYLFASENAGVYPAPILRAAHFNAPGTAAVGVVTWGFIADAAGRNFGTIEYVNWHDYIGADQLVMLGWQGTPTNHAMFRYINGHDAAAGATESAGVIYPGQAKIANGASGDYPCDYVDVVDSTIYRARGNAINYNVSSTTVFATGGIIDRNLVYDGCTTTGSGECGGIEVTACKDCDIGDNLVYNICSVDASHGTLFSTGAGSSSTSALLSDRMVVRNNWGVNGCQTGINVSYENGAGRNVTVVGNYISHVRIRIGRGGRWYGNVGKNWGLEQGGGGGNGDDGINSPEAVYSTFLLGADAAVAAAVTCGSGGGKSCERHGLYFDADSPVATGGSVVVQDVFGGGFYTAGGRFIEVDSNTDYNIAFSNITCNGMGNGFSMTCIRFDTTSASRPITLSASDIAVQRINQSTAIQCTNGTNVTDTVGNMLVGRSYLAADDVSTSTANCRSTGTWTTKESLGYLDSPGGDYNFIPGAFGLTAGAGSVPVGVRAFRHPRARISQIWGNAIPFDGIQPADVANVSNADTDGDWILDLYDNCDLTWNPNQYDGDGDGIGCACDLSGDTCP